MITVYYKPDKLGEKFENTKNLNHVDLSQVVWINLTAPTSMEKSEVEQLFGVKLLSRAEATEIETTSKYSEAGDYIVANTNYYIDKGKTNETEPVSFIITSSGLLISYHQLELNALNEAEKRIKLRPNDNSTGYEVFMTVLEAFIDYDADMEELLTREISRLSRVITTSSDIDKAILHRINELQEKSTSLREDVFDIQRVLSGIERSKRFPQEASPRILLMVKDAESLMNHGDISFSRLDYLQDTAMGLINIQQNEIVKILSVAAVIFMPPTLIASMYGMNFKMMPELDWVWELNNGWVVPAGYIFALLLMVVVTLFTYWFFKYKKWL
ncbi:MAG: magnesium and cobalt transport protein CorA [Muribaculaceae bacterium]|nr:magnesium and cobalt transport protein CorA [Muribaculaceae bacterium]